MIERLKHRLPLLRQLIRRDIHARTRGSILGLAWMLLTPLALLLVYSFVFGIVFEARWGVEVNGRELPFPLLLFSGLMMHGLLADVMLRAVPLMQQNRNYIKKVVFPVGLLVPVITATALTQWLIQLALLIAAAAYYGLPPQPDWLLLPLILLPLILLALGLGWLLAALSVFLPDIQQLIGLLTTVLLFLSPVFYPLSRLPDQWQFWLQLNPLTTLITQARALLFNHAPLEPQPLILLTLISLLIALTGYAFFRRARPAFADIL